MIRSLQNFCKTEEDWFRILKQFAIEHKHKCIITEELIVGWSTQMKMDLKPFFKQYLETTMIPELVYTVEKKKNKFIYTAKFNNVVEGFKLPVLWSCGTKSNKVIILDNKELSFELDTEDAQPNSEISFFITLK